MARPAGTAQVVLCGALQLLIFLGYSYLAALVIAQGYDWISAGTGVLDIYLRSVLSGSALFLFLFTVPILAKWILIGRWKPQQIRIWSLAYVRFWVVKTLVRFNPLVLLFIGSPLLLALPAGAGREGRARRCDLLHCTCPSAPTCSPSAMARSSAKTPSSTATEHTPGLIQTGPISHRQERGDQRGRR